MKILLTLPPSDALTVTPPIGIGYIAAVLRQYNYDVSILDPQVESLNLSQFFKKIKEINPDVLGVSILTSTYTQSKNVTQFLKTHHPNIKVIVGGPHSTALPKATLEETKADFLISGEGEYAFLNVIYYLEGKGEDLKFIPNLCYRENGHVVINDNAISVEDLDDIPFPAWDLIPPDTYPMKPHQFFFKKYPIAPIVTSRGCPFSCTFCSSANLAGRKLRRRSAKNVVDEIELLVNKYGVKEIHFEDDNFTLVRDHAKAICREIIDRKLDIVWQCPNGIRVDTIDEDLVQIMKKSGCYRLAFGIESGSQEILDRAQKQLDLKKVSSIIKMVKRAGIETHGFFILGLPGETHETIAQTRKLINELPLDFINASLLAYLPGSQLFVEKYMDVDHANIPWDDSKYFVASSTGDLSAKDIKKYQSAILRRFYFNPKNILRFFRIVKIRQLRYFYEGLIKYIG
jgi:radical SAM superfamily enzyme YgiQ (UPF0313 family)